MSSVVVDGRAPAADRAGGTHASTSRTHELADVIDPIAVQVGPFQLHWYGIIIACAVLIAAVLGSRVASWLGENPEDGWAMLLWVVVAAVIGARIYHVIHEWESTYSQNLALIPQVWRGGIGIPGGIVGGALAIWLWTRAKGVSTPRWLDIFAPALLLGQAIGRLGNFVNQELYGPPTTLPWGIPIDAAHRVAPWDDVGVYPVDTTVFHPLFAYEGLLNLLGMVVLLVVIRRFGPHLFTGDIALMYIMWYGAVRTGLETFRTDNWVIGGLPTAMWLGIIGFVLAGAWLIIRHRRGIGAPLMRPPTGPSADETDAAAERRAGTEASPG
jgi:phosphatidylglycerol:prolipoprotein diacylglycerol transferase